jgi:hypothetical protein
MRLPRLTVRRLMVAVAVVGLLCGVAERRQRFLKIASPHGVIACPSPACTPEQAQRLARANEYSEAMYRKYRLAASLPFLPVWPNPPEPD